MLDFLPTLAVRQAVQYAAWPKPLLKFRILWIVGILRLLFRIKVIEIAKEFVEAMHRRQEFVLVTKVVLAELACGVAMRFEQLGHGWILRAQTEVGPRQPDLGEARTDRILASDERRSTRGAALLSVVVGEGDAFVAHAVDVGRSVAHLSAAVVADIPPADVIALEDENVRLALLSHFNLLLVSLPISGQLTLLRE